MLDYLKQFAFGLDIGSSAVSVLKIVKKRGRLVLAGFYRTSLPPGLIRGGRIQDEKYLSEIIKKAAAASRPHQIRDFFVNLALPEQLSFLQVVQLPKMSFKEAASAIKWEIEANIPLPIELVYYDWQIISPAGRYSEGVESFKKVDHLDILIAAAPKDVVESYIRTAKQSGFYPKIVEIDSFSFCRSLIPGLYSGVPVLIVELSPVQATLVVFSGNAPRFSSSIPLSGKHFVEMAAAEWDSARKIQVRKITDAPASKTKEMRDLSTLTPDAGVEPKNQKIAVPIFTNFLIKQLRSYLEFYEEHAEHEHADKFPQIKKILLCGSGVFAGFDRLLAENLKIDVEIGNPFVNISKNPRKDFSLISVEESLALSKVLGLASKDLIL